MEHNPTATSVATINGTNILVIENGEKRVAIKPICEALGIDFSAQLQRLKRDEILNPTVVMVTTVGGDNKDREMATIPFKFVFGWLFTIDSSKVNPDVKDNVIRYKLECYEVLYKHFIGAHAFLAEKEKRMEEMTRRVKLAKKQFRGAREFLYNEQEELYRIAHVTYEEYLKGGLQLAMDFEEGGENDA